LLLPAVWLLGVVLGCDAELSQRSFARDATDFSRWEMAIAQFEQEDRTDPPAKNGVLFVGSSSIRLWDLGKSFPGKSYLNRGFGGSEIADSIHFADRLIMKHKPQIVVLYAGDNDLDRGKTPERVHADFKAFAAKIHSELPRTGILFIAIKPSLRRWKLVDSIREANRLIGTTCRSDKRLSFVDIFHPMLGKDGQPRRELFVKDGLHLNAAGYKLWSSLLLTSIEQMETASANSR
jgi:lysophospholipase L1-like esterase